MKWRDCVKCKEQYPAGDYKYHRQTEEHRAAQALHRSRVHPNAQRDADIVAWAKEDPTVTLQTIADRYGVTRQRIDQILKRAGIASRDVRKVRFPYYKWNTCSHCGVYYERQFGKQHRQTEEHRAAFDKRADVPKILRAVELYQEGYTSQAIVEIMAEEGHHIHQPYVYRHLRRLGIEPNRGGGMYARFENGKRAIEQPWAEKAAELYAAGVPPREISRQIPELRSKTRLYANLAKVRAKYGIPAQQKGNSDAVKARHAAERAKTPGNAQ